MTNYHLIPVKDGWALKERHVAFPIHTLAGLQKAEAIKAAAAQIEARGGGVLMIHRTNGSIEEALAFGPNAGGASENPFSLAGHSAAMPQCPQ